MPAFRRVLGERAGPTAVGVLVPPGKRTLVVVRPRALPWDLVLTQPGEAGQPGSGFREMSRPQAAQAAHQLSQALIQWAEHGERAAETTAVADGFWVSVNLGGLILVACRRAPGEAYRPAVFMEAEAVDVATQITITLRPPKDANHDLYTNTNHFTKSV